MKNKFRAKSTRTLRNALCLILLLAVIVTAGLPALAAKEKRTLKVGNLNHPSFIQQREDGSYYGYGVEYLDCLCSYTDWEPEYVSGSWPELVEMLERGEIDLLPMMQFSEERKQRFDFTSQPMGIVQCLLLTLPEEDCEDIGGAHIMNCDGKTIGIQRASRNIELLRKYAKDMGFSYTLREYAYQSELEDALFAGEIDIIACEQMLISQELHVIDRFGSDPFYIAVSKGNTKLLDELNYVMGKIMAYDVSFTTKLHEKYFGSGLAAVQPYFSTEEIEIIKNCGPITVALIPDSMPSVYEDENGEMVGIIPDIMRLISRFSGLKFQYVFVPHDETPYAFLSKNPEYLASGVQIDNPVFAESGFAISDSHYSTYSQLYAHKENAGKINPKEGGHTVATVTSFQAMHKFLEKNYPNLEIKKYLTAEEGLEALARKQVDFFAFGSTTMLSYLSNPRYSDLVVVDSEFLLNRVGVVGVGTERNQQLVDIINKCISAISQEDIGRLETKHAQRVEYHFDRSDFVHRYKDIIVLIAIIIAIGFAILGFMLYYRQRRHNEDMTRSAEYDMMTGTFNRPTLRARSTQSLEENKGRPYAFMLIDIDDLGDINEIRGHEIGDKAIKLLASILRVHFRDAALIGRVGADEFGIFLLDVQSRTAMVASLARLQNTISKAVVADSVSLRCSIGVAMGIAGEDEADDIYDKADSTMSRVKKNGKNGFAFYESKSNMLVSSAIRQESGEYVSETPVHESVAAEPAAPVEGSHTDLNSEFRELLEASPNIALYVIEQGTHKVLYYNKRFKEINPNVRLGMSCRNMNFGPCKNCIVDTMEEQAMAHTLFYSSSYGEEVEITATKITWDGRPAVMISSWPRTMLTSSSDKLRGESNQDAFDYVTGGLTRSGFIRMMERMQRGGVDLTDYAVLFLNIKEFKAVNEMVGYKGGDNLLRAVFTRFEKSRLAPVIGARKESDHFCFMVEKSMLDLRLLPELLNFHWQYEGKDLYIHCRCGVFNIEDGELEVYKMIDRAKLAKEHIVDEYVQPYAVYHQSMLEEYSERASAFLMFDNGIKNNEFVVYYQPVIDAKTGKIVSAEALVRRRTADGTVISPGKFIPILERTGYISMLDRFVGKEVGYFQKRRLDAGLPIVPISFNLSQKDYYDEELMDGIVQAFEADVVPRGAIMLEITETAYAQNEKSRSNTMKRLRDAGAKILLDDFGTGYSSFGMFENYNFDRVKLDMSFVRQLEKNENVRKVVSAIISMCHGLGVEVVAEGVETEVELGILKELDCDFIQGYYFSKPLDEESFQNYIKEHI